MIGDAVRCLGCPRWLGVQRAGHVLVKHQGREFQIFSGGIICEQCSAVRVIEDGSPVLRSIIPYIKARQREDKRLTVVR